MRFALECHECKWSTVVADDYLENWVKRHAEDDPTHSVTVRLVPDASEPDSRIDALEKRHNGLSKDVWDAVLALRERVGELEALNRRT